jgi:hypothetical protein
VVSGALGRAALSRDNVLMIASLICSLTDSLIGRLTDVSTQVVTEDGSACGRRVFAIWNPSRYGGATKGGAKENATPPGTGPQELDKIADDLVSSSAGASDIVRSGSVATVDMGDLASHAAGANGIRLLAESNDGARESREFAGSSAIVETALLLSSLVQQGVSFKYRHTRNELVRCILMSCFHRSCKKG